MGKAYRNLQGPPYWKLPGPVPEEFVSRESWGVRTALGRGGFRGQVGGAPRVTWPVSAAPPDPSGAGSVLQPWSGSRAFCSSWSSCSAQLSRAAPVLSRWFSTLGLLRMQPKQVRGGGRGRGLCCESLPAGNCEESRPAPGPPGCAHAHLPPSAHRSVAASLAIDPYRLRWVFHPHHLGLLPLYKPRANISSASLLTLYQERLCLTAVYSWCVSFLPLHSNPSVLPNNTRYSSFADD